MFIMLESAHVLSDARTWCMQPSRLWMLLLVVYWSYQCIGGQILWVCLTAYSRSIMTLKRMQNTMVLCGTYCQSCLSSEVALLNEISCCKTSWDLILYIFMQYTYNTTHIWSLLLGQAFFTLNWEKLYTKWLCQNQIENFYFGYWNFVVTLSLYLMFFLTLKMSSMHSNCYCIDKEKCQHSWNTWVLQAFKLSAVSVLHCHQYCSRAVLLTISPFSVKVFSAISE